MSNKFVVISRILPKIRTWNILTSGTWGVKFIVTYYNVIKANLSKGKDAKLEV